MGRTLVVKFNGTSVQALLCKQAIEMWWKHQMGLTRGFTISMAMKLAGKYTGKSYKRNEYEKAVNDLTRWISDHKEFVPVL